MIRAWSESVRTARKQRQDSQFLADVVRGLRQNPKQLSCKYFYDARGSALFDAICKLDEYYLTRTELAIMRRHSREMAEAIGPDASLIELGSGSSIKTRLLLNRLKNLAAYVPVDISRRHLFATARRLAERYPQITIRPVCADFADPLSLRLPEADSTRCVVYFPGSTIGNFEQSYAAAMLAQISALIGHGGGLLISIDLQKDIAILEAAYNDAQGVTAEFNLNLLARINRELGGNFNLNQFAHWAFYDRLFHRIDIRLVSRCDQNVQIGPQQFDFRTGECILTEYSHKYTIDIFEQMALRSGLRLVQCWLDDRQYFAVLYFVRN
jgi:dimethylhistidine N-methyltransferase